MAKRVDAWVRTSARVLVTVAAVVALAGCPRTPVAMRDGGTPCEASAECNPPGATCGSLFLCVQNYCAIDPILRTCDDGGYPGDTRATGNCASYEDCNPPPACGLVVSCVNFQCDLTGPRLEIPCPDGGDDAAGDAAGDAVGDTPGDGARDAGTDGGD